MALSACIAKLQTHGIFVKLHQFISNFKRSNYLNLFDNHGLLKFEKLACFFDKAMETFGDIDKKFETLLMESDEINEKTINGLRSLTLDAVKVFVAFINDLFDLTKPYLSQLVFIDVLYNSDIKLSNIGGLREQLSITCNELHYLINQMNESGNGQEIPQIVVTLKREYNNLTKQFENIESKLAIEKDITLLCNIVPNLRKSLLSHIMAIKNQNVMVSRLIALNKYEKHNSDSTDVMLYKLWQLFHIANSDEFYSSINSLDGIILNIFQFIESFLCFLHNQGVTSQAIATMVNDLKNGKSDQGGSDSEYGNNNGREIQFNILSIEYCTNDASPLKHQLKQFLYILKLVKKLPHWMQPASENEIKKGKKSDSAFLYNEVLRGELKRYIEPLNEYIKLSSKSRNNINNINRGPNGGYNNKYARQKQNGELPSYLPSKETILSFGERIRIAEKNDEALKSQILLGSMINTMIPNKLYDVADHKNFDKMWKLLAASKINRGVRKCDKLTPYEGTQDDILVPAPSDSNFNGKKTFENDSNDQSTSNEPWSKNALIKPISRELIVSMLKDVLNHLKDKDIKIPKGSDGLSWIKRKVLIDNGLDGALDVLNHSELAKYWPLDAEIESLDNCVHFGPESWSDTIIQPSTIKKEENEMKEEKEMNNDKMGKNGVWISNRGQQILVETTMVKDVTKTQDLVGATSMIRSNIRKIQLFSTFRDNCLFPRLFDVRWATDATLPENVAPLQFQVFFIQEYFDPSLWCDGDDFLGKSIFRGINKVNDRCDYAIMSGDGVLCMHEAGFVHRDLKLSNLLFNKQYISCKILDFETSKCEYTSYNINTFNGTVNVIAPDRITLASYSEKCEKLSLNERKKYKESVINGSLLPSSFCDARDIDRSNLVMITAALVSGRKIEWYESSGQKLYEKIMDVIEKQEKEEKNDDYNNNNKKKKKNSNNSIRFSKHLELENRKLTELKYTEMSLKFEFNNQIKYEITFDSLLSLYPAFVDLIIEAVTPYKEGNRPAIEELKYVLNRFKQVYSIISSIYDLSWIDREGKKYESIKRGNKRNVGTSLAKQLKKYINVNKTFEEYVKNTLFAESTSQVIDTLINEYNLHLKKSFSEMLLSCNIVESIEIDTHKREKTRNGNNNNNNNENNKNNKNNKNKNNNNNNNKNKHKYKAVLEHEYINVYEYEDVVSSSSLSSYDHDDEKKRMEENEDRDSSDDELIDELLDNKTKQKMNQFGYPIDFDLFDRRYQSVSAIGFNRIDEARDTLLYYGVNNIEKTGLKDVIEVCFIPQFGRKGYDYYESPYLFGATAARYKNRIQNYGKISFDLIADLLNCENEMRNEKSFALTYKKELSGNNNLSNNLLVGNISSDKYYIFDCIYAIEHKNISLNGQFMDENDTFKSVFLVDVIRSALALAKRRSNAMTIMKHLSDACYWLKYNRAQTPRLRIGDTYENVKSLIKYDSDAMHLKNVSLSEIVKEACNNNGDLYQYSMLLGGSLSSPTMRYFSPIIDRIYNHPQNREKKLFNVKIIYCIEAYASDEWVNEGFAECELKQHKNSKERNACCSYLIDKFELKTPYLIDSLKNEFSQIYGTIPCNVIIINNQNNKIELILTPQAPGILSIYPVIDYACQKGIKIGK